MGDRLKQIPQRLLEFWKKFSSKQRVLIISIAAAVVVTAVIFVLIFTRTSYVTIEVFNDSADTAQATSLLEDQQIAYRVADDGVTLSVDKNKVADAKMVLGQNSVGVDAKESYNYDSAFNSSMSTTSKERDEKWKLALQNDLGKIIVDSQNGVDQASVQVTLADDTTSILEDEKENTCAAVLTINDDFKKSAAKGIAQYLATSIGSKNTDNIKIIDQDGNILFAGAENGSAASISSESEYRDTLKNDMKTQVQALLLKSSTYDDVEVAPNLEVNFDKSTVTDENYYTDDGAETGPKSYGYNYNNRNNSDSGNVPGTDANDGEDTDYDISNGSNSEGETTITKEEYNTSKRTTVTEAGASNIDYPNSSISIVLNSYREYHEEDMKDQLEENNQTFEQFKEANSTPTALNVDPNLTTLVSNATGIPADRISMVAYQVPLFYDAPQRSVGSIVRNYLMYLLALIIVGLLLFVVFKGMKPVEVEEMEPELSVEALLATTKDNQSLDDIEFSDKSAAREQIEKFVDENPDAVVQLLRNWLNEDWE